MFRLFVALFAAACLAAGAGCSSGQPKAVPVRGTVTWNDAPVPVGTVTFSSPDAAPVSLPISGGKYSGAVGTGAKRVEITATDAKAAPAKPSGLPGGEQAVQQGNNYIPKRYNTVSELSADVKDGGENRFDFSLKP